jgi:hypothetical protein
MNVKTFAILGFVCAGLAMGSNHCQSDTPNNPPIDPECGQDVRVTARVYNICTGGGVEAEIHVTPTGTSDGEDTPDVPEVEGLGYPGVVGITTVRLCSGLYNVNVSAPGYTSLNKSGFQFNRHYVENSIEPEDGCPATCFIEDFSRCLSARATGDSLAIAFCCTAYDGLFADEPECQ